MRPRMRMSAATRRTRGVGTRVILLSVTFHWRASPKVGPQSELNALIQLSKFDLFFATMVILHSQILIDISHSKFVEALARRRDT